MKNFEEQQKIDDLMAAATEPVASDDEMLAQG